MRSIKYSKIAAKSLIRLDSHTKTRMEEAILQIADNPLLGKKLKGNFAKEKLRSLKVWPYRIIYRFESNLLEIVYVEHRKDVYR